MPKTQTAPAAETESPAIVETNATVVIDNTNAEEAPAPEPEFTVTDLGNGTTLVSYR